MLRAAGAGMIAENPRGQLCAIQRAPLVGGSSVTNQCHAAKIRGYQIDYRRPSLTPVACSTASPVAVARSDLVDRSFHIS